jgi:hypothetical protein
VNCRHAHYVITSISPQGGSTHVLHELLRKPPHHCLDDE